MDKRRMHDMRFPSPPSSFLLFHNPQFPNGSFKLAMDSRSLPMAFVPFLILSPFPPVSHLLLLLLCAFDGSIGLPAAAVGFISLLPDDDVP